MSLDPVNDEYRRLAKKALQDAIFKSKCTHHDLARKLQAAGLDIKTQVLTNRLNRGAYSLAFAFQVLSVLGFRFLQVPAVPDPTQLVAAKKDADAKYAPKRKPAAKAAKTETSRKGRTQKSATAKSSQK